MPIELIDYAQLPPAESAALAQALGPLTTLERVLAWGRSLSPPRDIDEILTQDEYTHDVGLTLSPSRYLVFDTT